MKTCENCGERVYSLGCVNCDEAHYIEQQEVLDEIHSREEAGIDSWSARRQLLSRKQAEGSEARKGHDATTS